MLTAHRIALDPNDRQRTYFAKAAGCARFAYNWALAEWKKQYDAHRADPSLPKPNQAALRRQLKRLSKSLSRKKKGSRNRSKARAKLARLHARIANIRSDALHKLTSDLTRRFHTIGMEDLNVRGMKKNRRLSRSISDMGFHEFRRQTEYKTDRRGGMVVVADRFYPSSKTCSACGHVLDRLPLSARNWACPSCHARHDRDVNAAINLRNMAVSSTASACGGGGSGPGCEPGTKPPPAKQEANGGFAHT